MTGKDKCRILKEIRQKIADENDIPYVTRECRYQGECSGTCPRCESELAYLERQLARRNSMKKKVTVAALCAGMVLAQTGCSSPLSPGKGGEKDLGGAVPYTETETTTELSVTTGEVAPPEEQKTTEEKLSTTQSKGSTEDPDTIELTGEVAYPEEQEQND
ncbi:MAG: hypothetical protein IJI25_02800 [Eubacterium sp.]|nr:hypothetical protein [Eubacterium sp.]